MKHRLFAGVALGAAALGAWLLACGPADFASSTLINSVRILATRSDLPYAPPGQTVHSEVLAVDGRPDAASMTPMKVYWLPFVCINPPDDAYYACFSSLEPAGTSAYQAGTDGGAGATITTAISSWDGGADAAVTPGVSILGGGGMRSLPTGVDISKFLIAGSRVSVQLPANIVSSHPPVKGAALPYGLAVVFNIACAGQVEIVSLDAGNGAPLQIPIGCYDAQNNPVSPNDYVIGYSEIYAYTSLTNANPVISSFSFRDASVPLDGGLDAGVFVPVCNAAKCPNNYAIVGVPDASWQRDPQDVGQDGGILGEEIWVDYYSTIGTLSDDAILIFDPINARVVAPEQESLTQVTSAQNGTLWAVVHDNRGGANWITVPLHAH
jgi:hypothetical protein